MLNELLKALSNKDFVTARTCMESLLQDKIAEKIEEKKLEVVESMFNEDVELLEATHAIHIVDAAGKSHGKVNIHALDDKNAKFQADKLIGQKPYRGMSVAKIERIKEDVEQIDEISQATKSDRESAALRATVAKYKLRDIEKSGKRKSPELIAKLKRNAGIKEDLDNEGVEQIDEISQATKNSYMAKRGSQLSSMMYGSSRAKQLTGRQQANAVRGIKRAKGENLKVQEDLDNVDTGLCEAKIDGPTAIKILNQAGGSTSNFHELGSAEVDTLLHHAKIHKYRKSPNAPGSTARMFHQHLTKIARRHTDGYDGPSWK